MFRRKSARIPDLPPPEPTDWLWLARPAALFDLVVIGAVAAAIVYVVLQFAATTTAIGQQHENVAAPTPIPTATPRPVYRPGDEAAAGPMTVKVATVDRQRELELPGTEGRLAARGEWVAVDVVLRGQADRPLPLRSEDFELRTPNGEVFEVDAGATHLTNQALRSQGFLSPGESLPTNGSVSVRLLFDVPPVSRELRLVVWPGTVVDLPR